MTNKLNTGPPEWRSRRSRYCLSIHLHCTDRRRWHSNRRLPRVSPGRRRSMPPADRQPARGLSLAPKQCGAKEQFPESTASPLLHVEARLLKLLSASSAAEWLSYTAHSFSFWQICLHSHRGNGVAIAKSLKTYNLCASRYSHVRHLSRWFDATVLAGPLGRSRESCTGEFAAYLITGLCTPALRVDSVMLLLNTSARDRRSRVSTR
jgi:hypothetical protein